MGLGQPFVVTARIEWHMLGSLREMPISECEEFLRHTHIGRIGVRSENGVYVLPVAFALAEGAIWGHSAPGRKINLLRRWPHVGFEVDAVRSVAVWRSVLVQGTWHELTRDSEKSHARAVLLRAFEGNLWWATAGHGHRTSLADALLYRIDIEEISGRAQNL